MGYGSYSASDWSRLKSSRNLSDTQSVDEIFQRRACNPKFDPKFIGTRECFDSEEHPNTTPIVVGLDVTASMGYLAVEVATKALNQLIMKLYSTAAVEDPALMCAAYGDFGDFSPLQVTQFESDIRIAEQLLELYFENHGCGEVVPTCLWEFLSRHTNIDTINKRSKKGFLFTIGDNANIRKDQIEETIIMIGGEGNKDILIGKKMIISENEIENIPEIIISAIQLQLGKSLKDVLAQWDPLSVPVISAAIRQLSIADSGQSITL